MKRNYLVSVISDIHFGATDDPEFMYYELKKMYIDKLKKIPVDLIVIAGDLFHKKLNLDSNVSKYCFRFISDIIQLAKKRNIKVRIVLGTRSHDYNQYDNFISFEKDKTIDFKVIRTVDKENVFKNFKVLYIPEEYIDDENYYDEYMNDEYNLIVGHGMFQEVSFMEQEGEIDMKKSPIFDIDDFYDICKGPIIFGHIHIRQNFYDKLYYPGSFIRFCFGEEEPKGSILTVINTETNNYAVGYLENKFARKYKTININKILRHDIERIIVNIDNYFRKANLYKLRLIVNIKDDDPKTLAKIDILKNYFNRNKNIIMIVKDKNKNNLEKEIEEVIRKNSYILDDNINIEKKIKIFAEEEFGYTIDENKVLKILSPNFLNTIDIDNNKRKEGD